MKKYYFIVSGRREKFGAFSYANDVISKHPAEFLKEFPEEVILSYQTITKRDFELFQKSNECGIIS